MSFAWTEDPGDYFFKPVPGQQRPLVTLYDGVGSLVSGKPTVIAALGSGSKSFLCSWFVYNKGGDGGLSWVKPKPVVDKTLLQCVGKQLYFCTLDGVDVLDAVVRRRVGGRCPLN